MTRSKGAKNLPLTGEKAVGRLAEIAKESGLSLSEYIGQLEELEKAGVSQDGSITSENIQKMSSSLKANLFNQDEKEGDDDNEDDDETESYTCGGCGHESEKEFDTCPKCGASGFTWDDDENE